MKQTSVLFILIIIVINFGSWYSYNSTYTGWNHNYQNDISTHLSGIGTTSVQQFILVTYVHVSTYQYMNLRPVTNSPIYQMHMNIDKLTWFC